MVVWGEGGTRGRKGVGFFLKAGHFQHNAAVFSAAWTCFGEGCGAAFVVRRTRARTRARTSFLLSNNDPGIIPRSAALVVLGGGRS